ncbi:hypothetical protein [Spirosoma terrae]|uniref:Uncharacterized protein n=1 Tax=Spirosoma terrae TaxID=1968276 RepID=A0A6L9LAL4_9BACT|nr:hypothetical protein [Spirosoma terrae]NDU97615.1 hypothetical protein [Spirosoma terrae]
MCIASLFQRKSFFGNVRNMRLRSSACRGRAFTRPDKQLINLFPMQTIRQLSRVDR